MIKRFSLRVGLNFFDERVEQEVTNEITKLHCINNSIPVEIDQLAKEEIAEALVSFLFLVYNHNGIIKSRCC